MLEFKVLAHFCAVILHHGISELKLRKAEEVCAIKKHFYLEVQEGHVKQHRKIQKI